MSDSLNKPLVYLDHSASTPLDPTAEAVLFEYLKKVYGNPSSFHQIGRLAFDALNEARRGTADALSVRPEEIIFTGSGTESANLAIVGLARANKHAGQHLVVSAIEHKAVLESAKQLENEGFKISYVKPDEHGLVTSEAVRSALTDDTILVSIMYANNEIGTVQPLVEISKVINNARADGFKPIFHTDACQAPGLLPINPEQLGVDALTINSSKVYGPKGVGALYLKRGLKILPVVVGGEQEAGRRAGTENVPLIMSFSTALNQAVALLSTEPARLTTLRDYFITTLQSELPQVILNGHPTKRLPNNIHICVPDVEGESLVLLLDQAGICVATGSACSAHDLSPSHVLQAIGRSDEVIHGSLRFSLGRSTTQADIDYTLVELIKAIKQLQALSSNTTKIIKTNYAKNT